MKNIGESVQLTEREKSSMLGRISEYIKHTPLRSQHENVRPSIRTWSVSLYSQRFSAGLIVVAILFTSGVGVSFASTAALPGDALYAVKQIREEVTQRLIVSDVKRAEYAVERTHIRLQEAEALAVKGKLTPKTEALVTAKFEELEDRAQVHIAFLDKSKPARAEALRVTLAIGTAARAETLAIRSEKASERENEARTRIALAVHRIENDDSNEEKSLAVVSTLRVESLVTNDEAEESSSESFADANKILTAPVPTRVSSEVQEASKPKLAISVLVKTLNAQKKILEDIYKDTKEEGNRKKIKRVLERITKKQVEITRAIRLGQMQRAERIVREELGILYKTLAALEAQIDIERVFPILEPVEERSVKVEPTIEEENEPTEPFDSEIREIKTLPVPSTDAVR